MSSFIRTGFIESIERIEATQTARASGGRRVCYYESRNISLGAAWQRASAAFADIIITDEQRLSERAGQKRKGYFRRRGKKRDELKQKGRGGWREKLSTETLHCAGRCRRRTAECRASAERKQFNVVSFRSVSF